MMIIESFLTEGPKARAGGAPTEVSLHVEKTELETKSDRAFVENAGCLAVSAETSRRLCCDAAVLEVVHDSTGKVTDTKPRSRNIPTAMRRALDVRDQHRCRFPGCTHTLFLDAHHIIHFADGGKTELENLVDLCRRHHVSVHEHKYEIIGEPAGQLTFVAPERPSLMTVLPPRCAHRRRSRRWRKNTPTAASRSTRSRCCLCTGTGSPPTPTGSSAGCATARSAFPRKRGRRSSTSRSRISSRREA